MDNIIRNNKGRPMYMIWTEKYEWNSYYTFRSTLPHELINHTSADLISQTDKLRNAQGAEKIRLAIIRRLQKSYLTKFFFLPDDVISYTQLKHTEYGQYMQLLCGLDSYDDCTYSSFYNSLMFSVMCYHLYRAQFLSKSEFKFEIKLIRRRHFERSLKDQRAVAEYVKNYSAENMFFEIFESNRLFRIMTTGLHIKLIITNLDQATSSFMK